MIRIVIPGRAVPWSVKARNSGGFAQMYNGARVKNYGAYVRALVAHQAQEEGWEAQDGPVALTIVIQRAAPKSRPKRRSWTQKEKFPCSRPDCTNIQKLVEDAGTGILWVDDSRIVQIQTVKFYAPTTRPQEELVEIFVRRVEECPLALWKRMSLGWGEQMLCSWFGAGLTEEDTQAALGL